MKFFLLNCVFLSIFYEISSSLSPANTMRCPKNMQAFLVSENSTKQFCDCEDTFLYHPEEDFCYPAYRQGPCPDGYYFILTPGDKVAKCQINPCHIDGLVPFQGKCPFLWESGLPCKDENTYLGVNDDFQIECGERRYIGSWSELRTSKSCQKNSYLMPTSKEHTHYFCECIATYIYSAKNNTCHQAYRQGPCPPGSYYVLPRGQKEPKCKVNPCQEDGLVPFKGECHEIYKTGPPCDDNLTELTVTRDTFKLKCIYRGAVSMGGGGIINAPLKACPPGSRRVITGCKHAFQ